MTKTSAKVYIPQDFRGSLTLTSSVSQSVKIHGGLANKATLISENGSQRRYFVGNLPESSDHEGTWAAWQGDEILVMRDAMHTYHYGQYQVVDYSEGLQVSFVDELVPDQPPGQCTCC